MRLLTNFAICIALCLTAFVAHAADIWTCTYPDLSTKELLTTEFPIIRDELIEDDVFQLRFKILQNTDYGLVAVWSIADMEENFPNKKTPTIGIIAMVINKKTGELLRSITTFEAPDKMDTTVRGTCRHG